MFIPYQIQDWVQATANKARIRWVGRFFISIEVKKCKEIKPEGKSNEGRSESTSEESDGRSEEK